MGSQTVSKIGTISARSFASPVCGRRNFVPPGTRGEGSFCDKGDCPALRAGVLRSLRDLEPPLHGGSGKAALQPGRDVRQGIVIDELARAVEADQVAHPAE